MERESAVAGFADGRQKQAVHTHGGTFHLFVEVRRSFGDLQ